MLQALRTPNSMIGRAARVFALSAMIGATTMLSTSCSLVSSSQQIVSVSSSPSSARVTINGMPAGVTPLQYSVNRKDQLAIMIEKEGYHPVMRSTSRQLSTIGIIDVVFGVFLLVPLLGLLGGGAWEQQPDNLAVPLTPLD